MVSCTTYLAGLEDRSRSSVSLIFCICRSGIVCNSVVGASVCLGTTIVIVGTICFFFGFGLSLV